MIGLHKKKSYKSGQEVEEDEAKRITTMDSMHPSHDQHKSAMRGHSMQPPPLPHLLLRTPKTEIKVTEEELFDDIGKDVLLPNQTKPIEERR